MNIAEIKRKFELIKNAQGSKAKQALLKEFASDQYFVKVLEFIYNPYKRSGIAEKKLAKEVQLNVLKMDTIKDLNELIYYLVKNNTGSDYVVAKVQNFIKNNIEHEEFLSQVVTKTYRCGLTSTTINKVIPNLIPTFGVMLATKIEDCGNLSGIEVIGTKKLDGFRCTFIKSHNKFYSRQGIEIEGLVELQESFKDLPNGVYDGELLAEGEFKEAKDQYKATSKIARKKGEKRGLKFVCFDYIENEQDFFNGLCQTPCVYRKSRLEDIILKYKPEHVDYATVLYYGYYDKEKIDDLAMRLTDAGEEGLMINIANAPYECKRTKTLIKIKKFYTCDLEVIDYTEGKGEMAGMLGSLIVDYKGNRLNVGSGFSQLQRIEMWKNKEELIGRVVEVGYREETSNEDGGLSLRFPTFKQLREEGKEVSYN